MLLHGGSLTDQLEQCCPGRFNLRLIQQSWQRPLPDESRALVLADGRYALVREIFLQCADTPLVYGRSIIPAEIFHGRDRQLAYLGQRSLGDFLFARPDVRRGQFEIARIPATSALRKQLHGQAITDTVLWGRRSIFYIKDKTILVVEIFLPGVSRCIKNR